MNILENLEKSAIEIYDHLYSIPSLLNVNLFSIAIKATAI